MTKYCEICNKEINNDSTSSELWQIRIAYGEEYKYFRNGCVVNVIDSVTGQRESMKEKSE